MTKFDASLQNRLVVDSHCTACPVRNRAICSVIDPQVSTLLSKSMIHKRFGRHDVIWGEGDSAAYFAIIISGAVKLVQTLPDGKQQIVGLLFPSDCLGDLFVNEHSSFAEAVSDTELCCFPQREFERALEVEPKLEHSLLEKTFQDLVATRKQVATLGRFNARGRLAVFLVTMMEKAIRLRCPNLPQDGSHPVFEIPMSRSDIADYLGLSLETVSRQFTQMKNAGIIAIHEVRTIEVLDCEALCEIARA